ncbi:GGDEF domain-containing protein [Paraglaciecola hydrolytica]|uniref:diguanylate cyclase n=1 Tax=Paraglaciecola hydrolytica TaxID=1799789 RepID=A0A148KNP2_9ALTE|nr:GGDEF domain-containing protein [Paraglaciecola hydrolytica]KXI27855.1 diguanylate cyclase [Paraglaciecola hydrolytica]
MLKFWYKEFPQYPPDHADYWRVRLIEHTLLLTTVYFLVLSLINLFDFQDIKYAILDASGFIISLGIYAGFRITGHVNIAAWALTLLVTALLLLFVVSAGGYSHSLYWATLVPPIAFFLLGPHWGAVISAVVFTVCVALVYEQVQQQQEVTFGLGALYNVVEVSIAHILLFRFYEGTRTLAYQQLAAQNVKIQNLAERDKLTGLYNREKLDLKLEEMLSTILDTERAVTVMILDIDHFKLVNDSYGHLVGDKVLTGLAEQLRKKMRSGDLLARWGGEEFVVVLSNTTLDAGILQAERLRAFVAEQEIEGKFLTISLGLAQNQLGDTAETLLDRADKALYQAKSQGRNRVVA